MVWPDGQESCGQEDVMVEIRCRTMSSIPQCSHAGTARAAAAQFARLPRKAGRHVGAGQGGRSNAADSLRLLQGCIAVAQIQTTTCGSGQALLPVRADFDGISLRAKLP